jgi:hypothetical protein
MKFQITLVLAKEPTRVLKTKKEEKMSNKKNPIPTTPPTIAVPLYAYHRDWRGEPVEMVMLRGKLTPINGYYVQRQIGNPKFTINILVKNGGKEPPLNYTIL